MNIVLQHNMDVVKVEPDSDGETCLAASLSCDQHVGLKQEGQTLPTAFPIIKTEVKVRCENSFFLWQEGGQSFVIHLPYSGLYRTLKQFLTGKQFNWSVVL
jgi:hypothetical protein